MFNPCKNYSQNTSSAESVFKKSTEINSVNFSFRGLIVLLLNTWTKAGESALKKPFMNIFQRLWIILDAVYDTCYYWQNYYK